MPAPGAGASRRELMRSSGSGRRLPPAQPLCPPASASWWRLPKSSPELLTLPQALKGRCFGVADTSLLCGVRHPSNSRRRAKNALCRSRGILACKALRAVLGRVACPAVSFFLPPPFFKINSQQPGGRTGLVQLFTGGCIRVAVPTDAELSGACGSTTEA